MASEDRVERFARNEARFRDINDRLRGDVAAVAESDGEVLTFVCECGRLACADGVRIALREYEEVRSDPTRFVIVPGHELLEVEDVVTATERFAVVAKHPETEEIVRESDPRRPR